MSYAIDALNKNKKHILETYNLQSGTDFDDLSVVSELNLYNRLGETTLLELSFKSKKAKKETSDVTIALLAKSLSDSNNSKEYEKKYKQFANYVGDVNQKWDNIKKKLTNLDNSMPDQIANVEIESISDNIVIYHTMNRFVKREKSGIPGNLRYKIMGYSLGRFHSQEYAKVSFDNYKPYFDYLDQLKVDSKIIAAWKNDFEKIKGSSYILGDCSLENVQYNAIQPGRGVLDSICLIDPVFLNNRDRYEDMAGILASLGREIVYNSLASKPEGSLRELLGKTFRSIMDASNELISAYKQIHPDLLKQTPPTADFFVGTFLTQYSYQYTGEDKFSTSYRDILQVLGTQFLTEKPIKDSLKS